MSRTQRDDGQVTAFVVIMALGLLLFGGLVIDGGYVLAAKRRAMNEAQSAARAGAQAINVDDLRNRGAEAELDPEMAVAIAQNYLAQTGHSGSVTVAGNTVSVTVSFSQPLSILSIVGVGNPTVTGQGHARNVGGVVREGE